MELKGNVVIAQGGGPTAVINQSLVGAVLESRKFNQVGRVYGAIKGVEGIINEDFIDLTQETTHNLELVAKTPSAALLSTRVKPDLKYCAEIFEMLKLHNVRYFFYIGGNDSSDTVRLVNDYAHKENYEFRAIHIPKTVDNDLVLNDHTPGYGSAARFVAQSFIGANLETRALGGIYIGVVMGRHAGFLAASAALGKKFSDDGPHLIYMPERAFDLDRFTQDVRNVYKKYGRCVIAMSEGIINAQGQPIASTLRKRVERDAHGNVELAGGQLGDMVVDHLKRTLKVSRVRADTFGYLQRSFAGCVSDVDMHEAREVGEKAAHFAIWHNVDGSITINRTGDYAVDYSLVKLKEIAAKTRLMPDEYINESGNNVTHAFLDYARPLVGSNMPKAQMLRAPFAKQLKHD
ncbi:6-phosphofructokinase [Clostridia bacterium]|nr:6-phosphofructokinase [Clostridia bacterium]